MLIAGCTPVTPKYWKAYPLALAENDALERRKLKQINFEHETQNVTLD
jgi:hypothetical protein